MANKEFTPVDFVSESNKIEGICRFPKEQELEEYHRFMKLDKVTVADLEQFVSVYQKGAKLRIKPGMNVRIGTYYPPEGSPEIVTRLQNILEEAFAARMNCDKGKCYYLHHAYEQLHPFMDGNGRSGRMLWMWMMEYAPLGFLHTWYYQSLNYGRK